MDRFLIVGLGNPGLLYENTRHNLGFKVVKRLAKKHDLKFKNEKKFEAKVANGKILDFDVYLILPKTYMNESGRSVIKAKNYLNIDIKNILIVVDDADIPFEEFRIKDDSSSGGHKGIESVETHLKTKQYARLKVGIGREQKQLKSYVLDRFTSKEKEKLFGIEDKGAHFIELWMQEGIKIAANYANVRLKKSKEEKQNDS